MSGSILQLAIPGAFLARPRRAEDRRGWFFESWRENEYAQAGADEPFVQDNISLSTRHVVRGLHYQADCAQGQLVTIVSGQVFDVIVDLRIGSPTFGRHESLILNEAEPAQFYMPPGVAHGYCVLSDSAILHYKCTKYYAPSTERGLRWNDPAIGIAWPVENPIVAPRDAEFPILSEIPRTDLATFGR